MTADELVRRIIEYGADKSGLDDRFCGDVELYKSCFDEFIVEANFDLLRDAMSKKDYDQAFRSAHALKGLAGNLGVTAFYDAIHTLVESFREKRYSNIDAEYLLGNQEILH